MYILICTKSELLKKKKEEKKEKENPIKHLVS